MLVASVKGETDAVGRLHVANAQCTVTERISNL